MDFLRRALAAARGRPACLATVIRTSGSTPRHPGAKMLIFADGSTIGTIGGGRVELEVTGAGARVAAGAAATRVVHHLVRDLAMCCGGTMELYLEPLAPGLAAIDGALAALGARRSVDLVTALDGSGKMLATPDDPSQRAPRLDGDAFVEPIRPRERAFLFGHGHVSRALGPLLAAVDFDVVLCDDNETGSIEGTPPTWAGKVIDSFDVRDVEAACGALALGDYAVVVTRDHAIDQRIVEALVGHAELEYLGLIGSQRKVERFRQRLLHKGVCGEAEWARVHAPIGVPIAAETPEEIAISIAAQLIDRRNCRRRGDA